MRLCLTVDVQNLTAAYSRTDKVSQTGLKLFLSLSYWSQGLRYDLTVKDVGWRTFVNTIDNLFDRAGLRHKE